MNFSKSNFPSSEKGLAVGRLSKSKSDSAWVCWVNLRVNSAVPVIKEMMRGGCRERWDYRRREGRTRWLWSNTHLVDRKYRLELYWFVFQLDENLLMVEVHQRIDPLHYQELKGHSYRLFVQIDTTLGVGCWVSIRPSWKRRRVEGEEKTFGYFPFYSTLMGTGREKGEWLGGREKGRLERIEIWVSPPSGSRQFKERSEVNSRAAEAPRSLRAELERSLVRDVTKWRTDPCLLSIMLNQRTSLSLCEITFSEELRRATKVTYFSGFQDIFSRSLEFPRKEIEIYIND